MEGLHNEVVILKAERKRYHVLFQGRMINLTKYLRLPPIPGYMKEFEHPSPSPAANPR